MKKTYAKNLVKKERWNKKLFPWRNKAKQLTCRKHKKVCTTLNYIEHFLILASLASTSTGCISISGFAYLLGIPIWIASSAIGITAGIKKHKSIIEKKKKKHNKIILLAKAKLNS